MPTTDYVTMPAGRELDALVAEKVMGLKPCSDPMGRCEAAHMNPPQCWGDGEGGSDLESYSTDIDAAWQVVTYLVECGISVNVYSACHGQPWVSVLGGNSAGGETAPLAICRAALMAVAESDASVSA